MTTLSALPIIARVSNRGAIFVAIKIADAAADNSNVVVAVVSVVAAVAAVVVAIVAVVAVSNGCSKSRQ